MAHLFDDGFAERVAGGDVGWEVDAEDDAIEADESAPGAERFGLIGDEEAEDFGPGGAAGGVAAGVGVVSGGVGVEFDAGVLRVGAGAIPDFLGAVADGVAVALDLFDERGCFRFGAGVEGRTEDVGEEPDLHGVFFDGAGAGGL